MDKEKLNGEVDSTQKLNERNTDHVGHFYFMCENKDEYITDMVAFYNKTKISEDEVKEMVDNHSIWDHPDVATATQAQSDSVFNSQKQIVKCFHTSHHSAEMALMYNAELFTKDEIDEIIDIFQENGACDTANPYILANTIIMTATRYGSVFVNDPLYARPAQFIGRGTEKVDFEWKNRDGSRSDMVALYNKQEITEEEVRELLETNKAWVHPYIIIITAAQYQNVMDKGQMRITRYSSNIYQNSRDMLMMNNVKTFTDRESDKICEDFKEYGTLNPFVFANTMFVKAAQFDRVFEGAPLASEYDEWEDMDIEDLRNLSDRTYKCLKEAGIDTIYDLLIMNAYQLKDIRNITHECIDDIIESVRNEGHASWADAIFNNSKVVPPLILNEPSLMEEFCM